MSMRTTLLVVTGAAAMTFGFWFYGAVRTMIETVYFDPISFLKGLAFALVLPLLFAAWTVLLVRHWWPPTECRVQSFVTVLVAGVVVGSVISEAAILLDETRFAQEVAMSGGQTLMSRARAWPNELGALVFKPGEGIHSTD